MTALDLTRAGFGRTHGTYCSNPLMHQQGSNLRPRLAWHRQYLLQPQQGFPTRLPEQQENAASSRGFCFSAPVEANARHINLYTVKIGSGFSPALAVPHCKPAKSSCKDLDSIEPCLEFVKRSKATGHLEVSPYLLPGFCPGALTVSQF